MTVSSMEKNCRTSSQKLKHSDQESDTFEETSTVMLSVKGIVITKYVYACIILACMHGSINDRIQYSYSYTAR